MKIYIGLWCICLVGQIHGQPFDFSNLGAEIESRVKASLAPLENLGSSIQAQVQQGLPSLENLGSSIQAQVQQGLPSLENLGSSIQAQVQQGLLPLQAMTIRLQMINGIGGVTVVQFPNQKQLLVRNGKTYTCDGPISPNGDCGGKESELDLNVKENYCYIEPNVRANNYLCFTNSQEGIFVSNNNGHVECKTQNGAPYLLITQEDYNKMCGFNSGQKIYKYIPKGPDAIHLPIQNPHFSCSNDSTEFCVFT